MKASVLTIVADFGSCIIFDNGSCIVFSAALKVTEAVAFPTMALPLTAPLIDPKLKFILGSADDANDDTDDDDDDGFRSL